jgi:hypothetical protein
MATYSQQIIAGARKQQAVVITPAIMLRFLNMAKRNDLRALRNMISEAHRILLTTVLPEARAERACELLQAAVSLTDFLMDQSPASALGKKGGKVTAKRGSEYFRKIAAMRKERKGGRPSKDVQ